MSLLHLSLGLCGRPRALLPCATFLGVWAWVPSSLAQRMRCARAECRCGGKRGTARHSP